MGVSGTGGRRGGRASFSAWLAKLARHLLNGDAEWHGNLPSCVALASLPAESLAALARRKPIACARRNSCEFDGATAAASATNSRWLRLSKLDRIAALPSRSPCDSDRRHCVYKRIASRNSMRSGETKLSSLTSASAFSLAPNAQSRRLRRATQRTILPYIESRDPDARLRPDVLDMESEAVSASMRHIV